MTPPLDDLDEFIRDQWPDEAFRDAYVLAVLWDAQRRIYNGAPGPWQELYDRGAAPVLEQFIAVLSAWLSEARA